jgi:hypothetical protein
MSRTHRLSAAAEAKRGFGLPLGVIAALVLLAVMCVALPLAGGIAFLALYFAPAAPTSGPEATPQAAPVTASPEIEDAERLREVRGIVGLSFGLPGFGGAAAAVAEQALRSPHVPR